MKTISKTKLSISKKHLPEFSIDDVIDQITNEKNSLTSLGMHYFTQLEIEHIIPAIKDCLALEEINLSKNMMEDTQASLVVKLIDYFPKLRQLDVSHSFLSERGVRLLHEACKAKNIELNISFSRMSPEKTALYQPPLLSSEFDQPSVGLIKNHVNLPINPQTLMSLIPNYQQDYNYDCGAASMLNVVQYFDNVLQRKPKITAVRELVKEIKTCNKIGAEIEHMVTWFENNHYQVSGGFGGTEAMLRYYIGLGIPVIVNTIEWGGHYLVVTHFETFDPVWPEKDKIWCCDSLDHLNGDDNAKPYPKRNLLRFLDEWRDSKYRYGGYIVALPKEIAVTIPNWKFVHE